MVFDDLALVDGNQAYIEELKNFVSSIQGQASPACSGEDALKSLAIALAARRALIEGRVVSIFTEDEGCVP